MIGPMKKAPKTSAMGSLPSAVRIEAIPPTTSAPRKRMRQSASWGSSVRLSPLSGNRTMAAMANRAHATKKGCAPAWVRALPAVSPATMQNMAGTTMVRVAQKVGLAILGADVWGIFGLPLADHEFVYGQAARQS